MDWNWVTGGFAAAALVGHAVRWILRHSDAERLEKMKAEIGRDVAESLKQQESRLRVEGELRIRVHDRSWQLLREVLVCAFEARDAVADIATLVSGGIPKLDKARELHTRAFLAVTKLTSLAATAPPEHDVIGMASQFQRALELGSALIVDETLGRERSTKANAVRDECDRGLEHAGVIAKAWNASLWNAPVLALESPKPPRP